MRAIVAAAGIACLLLAGPSAAQTDASKDAPPAPATGEVQAQVPMARPSAGQQPGSKDECLQALELTLARALEVELLDDQIDEAELHLERFEAACLEGKFEEALTEAVAIEKILVTNK